MKIQEHVIVIGMFVMIIGTLILFKYKSIVEPDWNPFEPSLECHERYFDCLSMRAEINCDEKNLSLYRLSDRGYGWGILDHYECVPKNYNTTYVPFSDFDAKAGYKLKVVSLFRTPHNDLFYCEEIIASCDVNANFFTSIIRKPFVPLLKKDRDVCLNINLFHKIEPYIRLILIISLITLIVVMIYHLPYIKKLKGGNDEG
jgi:hypothetical protein